MVLPGHRLRCCEVSPNGEWAIVATREMQAMRDDTDVMPHYIQEDGRIASKAVRQRVVTHTLKMMSCVA